MANGDWYKIGTAKNAIYKIDKAMLPGDFIAMRLTGEITTSISALSEGVFFDFKTNSLSKDIINYYGFDEALFPEVKEVFIRI